MESRTLWDEHFRGWTLIHSALQEASLASGSTIHSFDDSDRALKWYVALLYLERARAVWAEHVGRPLALGTA